MKRFLRAFWAGWCYATDLFGILIVAPIVLLIELFAAFCEVVREWWTGDIPAFLESAERLRRERLAAPKE